MASAATDHYSAVIADLESKREEIDRLIKSLKAFAGSGSPEVSATPRVIPPSPPKPPVAFDSGVDKGKFYGMSIADAAIAALRLSGYPMGNAEIVDALVGGGLQINSDQPLNVVGSILNRRLKENRDIARVGRGIWSLPEWIDTEEAGENDASDMLTEQPPAPPTVFSD
ncbi:MAG TPA: winged helix-turn-helix domain-containing protein [Aurantimonas sp.]